MNIKDIKGLIEAVEKAEITSFYYKEGEMELEISKEKEQQVVMTPPTPTHHFAHTAAPAPVMNHGVNATSVAPVEEVEDEGLVYVTSPMVGTFYEASSPDAAPFVKVGDKISKGQVVCIVEAMKMFNEIESEVAGTVEKILISNQDAVEYGQNLIAIRL